MKPAPCQLCAKWRCSECSWVRTNANRWAEADGYTPHCHRCQSTSGIWLPGYHRPAKAWQHSVDNPENTTYIQYLRELGVKL